MGDIGVPVGWYDEILRNPYGIRTPAVRCIVYELVRCGRSDIIANSRKVRSGRNLLSVAAAQK